ncbi:MAG TPA: preprotein translocase subunit SecE [Verrucomicrobiae bacterium]|nr:preprotein translocase subunit SecE [Verrucomicrobiae bacterium]
MNTGLWIIGGAVVVVFGFLWKTGQLARLKNYWDETMAEMHKCAWPTWNELKGSTIVVMISIAILGGFTMLVDAILVWCARHIT